MNMERLIGRFVLWIAASLLGLQSLVITADFLFETLFLDELIGFGITAALVWLVRFQKKRS